MAFLNKISMLAFEAGERYNKIGADALGREAKEISDAIYYALEEMGCYKN